MDPKESTDHRENPSPVPPNVKMLRSDTMEIGGATVEAHQKDITRELFG
jgi:hypothetical protein